MYTPSPAVTSQIDRAFRYHPPLEGQPTRYAQIRDMAGEFAELVARLTPPSREQSIALTKLEEAVMFANAAIARNETH